MVTELIVGALASYPEFTIFMTGMGMLRTINKPIFALIQTVVDNTDTDTDDKWWNKTKNHKAMRSVFWLLDWTASVKLPGKK